jgi:hypothetical protein
MSEAKAYGDLVETLKTRMDEAKAAYRKARRIPFGETFGADEMLQLAYGVEADVEAEVTGRYIGHLEDAWKNGIEGIAFIHSNMVFNLQQDRDRLMTPEDAARSPTDITSLFKTRIEQETAARIIDEIKQAFGDSLDVVADAGGPKI